METPVVLTDLTPRHLTNATVPTRAKSITPATLLEFMMVKRVEPSPYMKQGPELPVSIWEPEQEGGFVRVRVDVPGVNKVLVYLDPSDRCVKFKGYEEEISMHGIDKDGVCRTYQGSFYLDVVRFPQIHFDFEFANGVIFFKFRCMKPATSADLGVLLLTNNPTREMKQSAYNPLVSQGTDRYSFHGFLEDGTFVMAIDTPGLGELDDLTMHAYLSSGIITFIAQEKFPVSYDGLSGDELRRKYEIDLNFNSEEFDTKDAQFEFKHGVLWIQVPRAHKEPLDSVTLSRGAEMEVLQE